MKPSFHNTPAPKKRGGIYLLLVLLLRLNLLCFMFSRRRREYYMHQLYHPAGHGEGRFYDDDYNKYLRVIPLNRFPALVEQFGKRVYRVSRNTQRKHTHAQYGAVYVERFTYPEHHYKPGEGQRNHTHGAVILPELDRKSVV